MANKLQPCPFCGGRGRIARLRFKKHVAYCASCSACTPYTYENSDSAVEHWNHLQMDTIKLEDYMASGVACVAFSDVCPVKGAEETAFHCESVGMAFRAEGMDEVVIEMGDRYLYCDSCTMYGRIFHNTELAPQGADIQFVRSEREHGYLRAVVLRCGEKTVTISADREEKRILVVETAIKEQ